MKPSRKETLLKLFLHVNRELNGFQRDMITEVMSENSNLGSIHAAKEIILNKVVMLEAADWKPAEAKSGDAVTLPDHYHRFPMEPTFFLVESGGYHWCLENFLKYVVRFPFKHGIVDLRKAHRCLVMYLAWAEGDPRWSL